MIFEKLSYISVKFFLVFKHLKKLYSLKWLFNELKSEGKLWWKKSFFMFTVYAVLILWKFLPKKLNILNSLKTVIRTNIITWRTTSCSKIASARSAMTYTAAWITNITWATTRITMTFVASSYDTSWTTNATIAMAYWTASWWAANCA